MSIVFSSITGLISAESNEGTSVDIVVLDKASSVDIVVSFNSTVPISISVDEASGDLSLIKDDKHRFFNGVEHFIIVLLAFLAF